MPPSGCDERRLAEFVSNALTAVGGSSGPGDAVVSVYINREKGFSFVELRTVEEATNCMALDSILFDGATLRVRRPNDYNPIAAAALGSQDPNPNLNLSAVGLAKTHRLAAAGAVETDGTKEVADRDDDPTSNPDRIFVGGLPYWMNEEQIVQILESAGDKVRTFLLIRDKENGGSKGYGFAVYEDVSVVDKACEAFHGLAVGDKTLTVRRANVREKKDNQDATKVTMALSHDAGGLGGVASSRVLILLNAVQRDELFDQEDYNDIMEDMYRECAKYGGQFGRLQKITIPRPVAKDNPSQDPAGVGRVIIEYSSPQAAAVALQALHGRSFGDEKVTCTFMDEQNYMRGMLGM